LRMDTSHVPCRYDIIYDIIKDLAVPSREAVAFQMDQVALCLGPSTVELTLPLNATECPKLSLAPVAGNQVVVQDGVETPCSPLHDATSSLGGICSSCSKFSLISISDYNYRYRRNKFDIDAIHSISVLIIRYRSYDFDIIVTTSVSNSLDRYRRSILCKITVRRRGDAACSPSNVRISSWHASFPWPKHVEKAPTFSLDSNRTSFFNTPAHHTSVPVRNVIKGWRKSPLEITLQTRSKMMY
jgi:hypothetical protein